MNQRVKRAIAAAMSLTMVATATPVSPLYNAIQNAVSSAMMQANAGGVSWNDIEESDIRYAIDEPNGTLYISPKENVTSAAMPDWEESMPPVMDDSQVPPWAMDDIAYKVTSVVIGNGITNIGDYAFPSNFNLKNVTIPSSVTTIGKYAFSQTNDLESVQFGENSLLTTIGEYAFMGCGGLKNVTIPASVTTIGANAFKSCGIENVTFGENSLLSTIGDYAFEGCSSLKNVTIPSSVTTIGANAFDSCNSEGFTAIEIPASVETIGEYAFFNCIYLGNVTFADGSKLTTIGEGAFQRCTATDIKIPYSVTNIGSKVFSLCKKLSSITAPCTIKANETTWKGDCTATVTYAHPIKDGEDFCACHEETTLPKCGENLYYKFDETTGKLTIGLINPNEPDTTKNAMTNWESPINVPWNNKKASITSVEIKEGVTSIGECAFFQCTGLTSVTIPDKVTSIGDNAFYCCSGLTSVTIPNGVTSIGNYAFWCCKMLESVTIPASVTTIGTEIFNGCEKLKSAKFAEASQLKSIEAGTFNECKKLSDITIPASVTTIGVYAFSRCTGLTSIKFEGDVPEIKDIWEEGVGMFAYFNTLETPVMLYYPKGNDSWEDLLKGKSEIFEWQDGYFKAEAYVPYTKIEGKNLKWAIDEGTLKIELDDTTKTVEQYADDNAMPNWESSNNVPWNNKKASITSVEIGKGVTSIGVRAFGGYKGLTSVTIPDSVTSIGERAFFQCSGLTSVTIPDSVTSIGERAFFQCLGLTSVTIPDSVTSIGEYAFYGCLGLKSVTIPDKVTGIGDSAFSDCTSLESVKFAGAKPGVDIRVFYNVGSQSNPVTLYYPKGNESWEDFFKTATITDNVLSWQNGYFKAEAYTPWNKIDGTNLQWKLEDNGKLTIDLKNPDETDTTKNAMPDWAQYTDTPWYSKKGNITSVKIEDGVTSIGSYAFRNCKNLTSITIPDSVTSIGNAAFSYCSALENITIPDSVTEIGKDAFCGCTNLSSITIPDSVTEIGTGEFLGCTNLSSITAPCTIKAKEVYWKDCSATVTYTHPIMDGQTHCTCGVVNKIGDKNLYYTLADNKLTIGLINPNETDTTKNAMTDWVDYTDRPWENIQTSITSVEICDGVTKIGDNAFFMCSGLTSVTIPDSVTVIGSGAFSNCIKLRSVTIGNGVESIDDYAFYGCTSLESVKFAGAKPDVNTNVFGDVGSQSNPVTLYYPKDNTSWNGIEDEVDGKQWQGGYFKAEAYLNWNDIADTNLHWAISGNGTLYIEPKDTTATTGNAMPDWGWDESNKTYNSPWYSVKDSIKSVEIKDDVTSIGSCAFCDCSELTDITIPNSVTSIGSNAFRDCSALTEVTIPNSVTSIGGTAFYGCTSLKDIVIPASVTTIGISIFHSCKNLESVKFAEASKLKSIAAYTFNDCKKLSDITIPASVTTIGLYAFYNCTSLTDIVIPSGVTKFYDNAFLGCTGLTSIKFEGNVPEINGVNAFTGVGTTDKPAKLIYPKDNSTWTDFLAANADNITDNVLNWEGGYFELDWHRIAGTNLKWTLDLNGKLTIGLINPNETDTTKNAIPDCGSGNSMSTANMPWGKIRNSIKSVEIKNGVSKIGFAAFYECALESITIPGSVKIIDNYAFDGCGKLETVTIANGVESIGDMAFSWCESLTSITIPESVTSIGEMVFFQCKNLPGVKLPENITSISESLFEGCSSFKSTDILDNITNIGLGAFYNTAFESLTIPASVESIGECAFGGCKNLTKLTFEGAKSSIEIGECAFSGCKNLTELTFEGAKSSIEIGENAFEDGKDIESIDDVPILRYPKGDESWEKFLADNASNITNGVLFWEGGYFKPEAYLNWKNIDGTALRWAISVNGTLYIDKQENAEPTGNFDVPAYNADAPWKDLIDKIRFVDISSSVTGVSDKSFTDFKGQAILVLENGSTLTPTPAEGPNYDSLGGGQFIYSKSQLTGASLSLAGKIGVNLSFYITEENPTIIINDTTIELTDPNLTIKNNVYTYTLEVAPRDAYDDITFEVKKDSETIIAEDSYNVKDKYVDVVLADTEHKKYNKKVFDMVSALDTYINSSRVYFNEVDEAEATALKTSINTALANLDLSGLDKNFDKEDVEGIEYYGSSLILNSGVKLRHYITIADEADIENIKIKVGDDEFGSKMLEKASFTSNSHDVYYFETEEFNPKDFGKNVSVIYNGEKKIIDNYSVLTFISLSLGKAETAATDLGTTCKSIYNYYLAADTYNKN